MEFIEGNWYKSPKWETFYIKVYSFDGESIRTKEKINIIYKIEPQTYNYLLETYSEASIDEIEQYLPKDHPDLFKPKIQEDYTYLIELFEKLNIE